MQLRRQAVVLALLLGLPFFFRLGAAPLFDVDEGAFSEATREMLESGDWGFTTLNGEPRFDKPILVYWLQALCVAMLGAGETAFRLPSALCAWGWCLAIVHFAQPRLGRTAAWLAGVIAATSVGVLLIGRAATADGLLNLLLALALFDGWRHLETGAAAPLRRAYAWIGLGLLAKGPIAALVPAAAALLFCVSSGRMRDLRRAATDWRGWLLLLAIAAPWYAYAWQRHGQAFIDGFIVRHNLARYGSVLEGHGGSGAYYLLMLPLLLLPWPGLLALVSMRLRTLWAEPLSRFLMGWAVFVLVFFSFSGTKLPHYALYGATPLFLLMARAATERPRAALALVLPALAGLLALFAALPAIAARSAASVGDPLYRELLAAASMLDATGLHAAVALAVLGLAMAMWLGGPVPRRLAGAALAVALALGGGVTPWAGELLQGPVRRAALVARQDPAEAVQWGVHQPSFSVYRGRATRRQPLDQPLAAGTLALARADRIPPGTSAVVIHREPGYVLLKAPAH